MSFADHPAVVSEAPNNELVCVWLGAAAPPPSTHTRAHTYTYTYTHSLKDKHTQ